VGATALLRASGTHGLPVMALVWSPLHRQRKFSTVLGATPGYISMTMRPATRPATDTSMKTRTCAHRHHQTKTHVLQCQCWEGEMYMLWHVLQIPVVQPPTAVQHGMTRESWSS
jgi:hypothetical protein